MNRASVLSFATLLVVCGNARASQIAIGLRNRGVFLQEYWTPQGPFYLVVNWTDNTARLGMRGCSYDDDGMHFSNWRYGAVVRAFTIDPHAIVHVEAVQIDSMKLVDVLMDGKSIGLLEPASRRGLAESSRGATVINSAMNYWGGGPDDTMWFEQDSVAFKSGKEVRITLAMKANSGSVGIGPYAELGTFISSDPTMGKGEYTYDLPFPLLLPFDAKSSTLLVTDHNGLFAVDSADAKPPSQIHLARLTFRAPQVDRATPVIISGFRHRRPGWGHWITLMVVVEP